MDSLIHCGFYFLLYLLTLKAPAASATWENCTPEIEPLEAVSGVHPRHGGSTVKTPCLYPQKMFKVLNLRGKTVRQGRTPVVDRVQTEGLGLRKKSWF